MNVSVNLEARFTADTHAEAGAVLDRIDAGLAAALNGCGKAAISYIEREDCPMSELRREEEGRRGF